MTPDLLLQNNFVWIILTPLFIGLTVFILKGKWGPILTPLSVIPILIIGIQNTLLLKEQGAFFSQIGGWGKPLGIEIYFDGLAAFMILTTALVMLGISVYSIAYFDPKRSDISSDKSHLLWTLLSFSWASLNALFLSNDIFNVYVTLEMLGFTSIALLAAKGTKEAYEAGIRYFLIALMGSLIYLMGVAVIYSQYGSLSMQALSQMAVLNQVTLIGISLLFLGLLVKSAIFPLHFWLPPAHSNAYAPISALLSGLVIMATYYLMVRYYAEIFREILPTFFGTLLGILGVLAILWGSFQALLQKKIKMLVAYSTVSQIGYMFLLFPLIFTNDISSSLAWKGGIYMSVAHAFGKASFFLAVGALIFMTKSENLKDLKGIAKQYPLCFFSIAICGVSLMGLPPSGGFIGKWLLLKSSMLSGQWLYGIAILIGGILSAVYIFKVLEVGLAEGEKKQSYPAIPFPMRASVFALACIALFLGIFSIFPLDLLNTNNWFNLSQIDGLLS